MISLHAESNRTLLDAWEAFEASTAKYISLYRTALFRYTLVGMGGIKPRGARLTTKEVNSLIKTMASISITPDIADLLKAGQQKAFEILKASKSEHRKQKSYLLTFIDWCVEKGYFLDLSATKHEEKPYVFYPQKIERTHVTSRRGLNVKIIFSFDPLDYQDESLLPQEIGYHLQRIQREILKFTDYLVKSLGVRQVSAELHQRHIQRILGWLYRSKSVPLAELSFTTIVPFVKLDYSIDEFLDKPHAYQSLILAKAEALDSIKFKAKKLVSLLEGFFNSLQYTPSSKTRQAYISSVISLAKFLYKDETDETMAVDFGDIPLINKLRVFERKTNSKKPSTIQYLPWHEVLSVLEKLRFEADLKKSAKYKRPLSAQAKSLQNFLILGFLSLVPPSRQRVIRELELGRTLKYGLFKDGRFIPSGQLSSLGEAKYYIHLLPQDYKTGDIYGEWLGEFPNTEFSDGSRFYDYLNQWLFGGMRDVIAGKSTQTVFVGDKAGTSLSTGVFTRKIRHIFTRWTGIPMPPKDLRHCFRTYIDDPATGATEQERESAAYWMRHSTKTAARTYSHLSNEQKLRAGFQLSSRINQEALVKNR